MCIAAAGAVALGSSALAAGLPASRRAACCTHDYASGEGWVRWVAVGSCVLSGCAGVMHVAMQSVGRGSGRGGPPAHVAATAVCMALLRPSTDRHDTMAILGPFVFWRWWCHARLQKWLRMAATCRQEVWLVMTLAGAYVHCTHSMLNMQKKCAALWDCCQVLLISDLCLITGRHA